MNSHRMNTSVRRLFTTWLLLAVILTLAGPVSVARAASFVVTNLNDSGKGSLRQAILDATSSPGADTITFGVSGTILLSSTLGAGDAAGLTIDGTGQSITISGNDVVRVMRVSGVLTLRNLTIADGNANSSSAFPGWGGGIVAFGMLTVTGSTFSGNHATAGGAIANFDTLTVTGSTFSENNAKASPAFQGLGGGGIYNGGKLDVTDSTFSGNTASYDGGIYNNGGGIYNNGGMLTVTDSTFSGNTVGDAGCSGFSGCDGGSIYNNGGTLTVTDSTFSSNSAGHWGGGIYSRSMLFNVTDSTFSGNTAIIGGAILSWGMLTVTDSAFLGNIAQYQGGGIENYYDGTLIVTNTTFSENIAGITNFINGSRGGGIDSSDTLDVTNSTFSGNTAGVGSGIFAGGTATVTNSTFSGNNAYYSGSIYTGYNSTATLQNTIVANSIGGNCVGLITDGGGNLSWPDTTCPGLNADPLLGPLQDNGGPTQTLALLPGSPAIDAALLANCPATDQRGVSRPQGAGCDIGAVELEMGTTYNFSGFFPPVDNLPTMNTVKAGQGIPVKFSLGGDQGLDIFAAGYPISQQIVCDGATSQDAIEETVAVGSSSLSYDAASDTYTYLWKTNKAWVGTCRQLNVKLNDGTEHKANFKFVK